MCVSCELRLTKGKKLKLAKQNTAPLKIKSLFTGQRAV
ncbi:Uncharacterized protein dnm_072280 [Desulfonema magnum]|uniref:Uncharacterized protein n=1 Tax=Desulfonema magnum TaxID=45655 RepID=A0A975BT71_9BACT|nr:Uncharacterized protein dnm_072280 [Desulfonema magnum]